MSLKRLIVEYTYAFEVIGCVTSAKEYRIAFEFENKLGIEFVKDNEIHLQFLDDSYILISNYIFEEEYGAIRLLKNKAVKSNKVKTPYLLPEVKEFDFIVLLEGAFMERLEEIKEVLNGISIIQYYRCIEIDKLKSKDNLLF